MPLAIHWFRRDLRLRDNPALHAALECGAGQVLPLFILDDTIMRARTSGAARVAFLLDSLRALDAALRARGSRLIVRRGRPADVLGALSEQSGARTLFFNHDSSPAARTRDAAVRTALEARGLAVLSFHEVMLAEPHVLQTKAGTPYKVFGPYQAAWRAYMAAHPPPPEHTLAMFAPPPATIESLAIPAAAELGLSSDQQLPPGGEAAAHARLAAFMRHDNPLGIATYDHTRDRPALAATSQLSAYLHLGCIAPLACLRAAQAANTTRSPAIDTWVGELAWRDFYYQIMAHFPHVLGGAFDPQYDALAWQNDAAHFAAWCAGNTGYPIVDAAMRQLNREAWMHNRARMIVASFLVKDLLIDWRWGERYFMQQLVDGDHAANNGGWQWAAGTGASPQPYFRIFNPVSQGRKFDPQGAYVRRYVHELAHVPERYIHTPWAMPAAEQRRAGVQIGRTYPAPIVDHEHQRAHALALYRAARADRRTQLPPADDNTT
ncbi:MAG: deoxyribodipyrimidine photo-lyase [Kouleothrix sp.]